MERPSPDDGFRNVIPLTSVDKAVPLEQRQESMREAVVEVITDLVIRRLPPEERSPMFDAARDLLEQAERSLPELLDAAEPGSARDLLFRDLGLY
jgi:acyl-CoA reductase-like NAD-dependent aldehyde dehydrogenase